MIRRTVKKQIPVRIHSSLDANDHQCLAMLAGEQNSSAPRIVKLAVLEYLERTPPKEGQAVNKPLEIAGEGRPWRRRAGTC